MLTENFIKLLYGVTGMDIDHNTDGIGINIKGEKGRLNKFQTMFGSGFWTNSGFQIGTGTTPPVPSDYKLESPITENYNCTPLAKRILNIDGKTVIEIYGNITNTGSEAITVNEFGWYCSYETSETYRYLYAREVFNTPAVIKPGEVQAFSVRISL